MKTAKVFRHGNSQAVRLPKEFRVTDSEMFIKKAGDNIVLTPKKRDRWNNLKACLGAFKGPLERQQPKRLDERDWPQ
ncbi:MAG: antitoxin [Gammaproteobacteria bacterium]